jgi:DNA mismatch endonuclease (patch repair protein)
MRAVKAKDTAPELQVRRFVHSLGCRFRLHRKDLPGAPDIVFPRLRRVLFVHGCFWHGHSCKRGNRIPKTNREYWVQKIQRNRNRDSEHARDLEALGWRQLVIWECELRDQREATEERIRRYLAG